MADSGGADAGEECADRSLIGRGGLRGAALIAWLAARPPRDRDAAVERLLGIHDPPPGALDARGDLVGYVPSGVSAIVRAAVEVPILASDLFVDLGAGLGKVTMVMELLTGARTRGVELQPELARRGQERAARLGLEASCEAGDARRAELGDATVIYLYLPFTGATLDEVMERIRREALRRPLVVCALGLDLDRFSWLAPRRTDAFWLTIYDVRLPGAPPPPARGPSPLPREAAARIAEER